TYHVGARAPSSGLEPTTGAVDRHKVISPRRIGDHGVPMPYLRKKRLDGDRKLASSRRSDARRQTLVRDGALRLVIALDLIASLGQARADPIRDAGPHPRCPDRIAQQPDFAAPRTNAKAFFVDRIE